MNEERIELVYDPGKAQKGAAEANKAIESTEKTAERAAAAVGKAAERSAQGLVYVADRSKNRIESMLRALERREAISGKSGMERFAAERALSLKRFEGDPVALERASAMWDRMAVSARKAETASVSAHKASATAAERTMRSMGEMVGTIGLLAGAYGALRGIVQPLVIDTTLYAARTEQLGIALNAVAKANNISAGTAATVERQIAKLNVTTQDARGNLARLIAAHIELSKASQIARAAQDLGRVSGEGTAAAFERMTHAIVTGQPELLRQLGLSVNLEKAYQRFAKEAGRTTDSLTEHEKMQIRVNEVLKAATAYAGVYGESLNTVTGRLLSLERKANEARNSIGERFQTEAGATIKILEKLAETAQKHPGKFVAVGAAGVGAAGAIAAAFGGPLLASVGLVAAAVGSFVLQLELAKDAWDRNKANWEALTFDEGTARKNAEDAARSVAGAKLREGSGVFDMQGNPLKTAAGSAWATHKAQAEEAAKQREEAAKRIAAAEKRTADLLKQARHAELEGLARIITEYKDYRRELGLSAQANRDLAEAAAIRIRIEAKKELRGAASDRLKEIDAEAERRAETDARRMKDAKTYSDETLRIEQQADMERLRTSDARIETQKEAEMRALAGVHATTLAQELDLVNRRLEIEERYITKSLAAKARMLDLEMEMEIAAIDVSTEAGQARRDAIIRRYGALGSRLNREFEDDITAARQTAANKRADIEIDAWRRTFENTKRGVESLLDQMFAHTKSWGDAMRSVLRAAILQPVKEATSTWIASMLTGARKEFSFGRATAAAIPGLLEAGNIDLYNRPRVRNADGSISTVRSMSFNSDGREVLVPTVSDDGRILTEDEAISLFERTGRHLGMFDTPEHATAYAERLHEDQARLYGASGSGGWWSRVTGRLRGLFGGRGGGVGWSNGSGFAWPNGGYGGTPPFNPNAPAIFAPSSASTRGGGFGGFGQYGQGLAGYGKGLLGSLSALGNIGRTTVPVMMPGGGMMGTTTVGKGVGGAAGGAMLLGGGILAMDGIRRGGWLGLAETTGGGALIGAKFGGPVGAAIGAAIGFGVGLFGLFRKSPEQKVIDKVRQIYGIRLDKQIAKQIVEIANQRYGKNLDMAIRTKEVRELIELYAQTTGQKTGAFVNDRPHGASLMWSGGSMVQAPTYDNGTAYAYAGPKVWGGVSAQPLGTGPVQVFVSPEATRSLWSEGTAAAIQGNPRMVAQSAVAGYGASAGRSGAVVATLAPGVIVQ